MATYTISRNHRYDSRNFYATIEEDYIITNRKIYLYVYKKNTRLLERSLVYGTYSKIPYKFFRSEKETQSIWDSKLWALQKHAKEKLEELEKEYNSGNKSN